MQLTIICNLCNPIFFNGIIDFVKESYESSENRKKVSMLMSKFDTLKYFKGNEDILSDIHSYRKFIDEGDVEAQKFISGEKSHQLKQYHFVLFSDFLTLCHTTPTLYKISDTFAMKGSHIVTDKTNGITTLVVTPNKSVKLKLKDDQQTRLQTTISIANGTNNGFGEHLSKLALGETIPKALLIIGKEMAKRIAISPQDCDGVFRQAARHGRTQILREVLTEPEFGGESFTIHDFASVFFVFFFINNTFLSYYLLL